MKKLIFIFAAVLGANLVFGQNAIGTVNSTGIFKGQGLTSLNTNPTIFLFVDSERIKIESLDDYNIKQKWIENTTLLKDDTSKQVYGNKNGVIIIYTKPKYRKKVWREINENKEV